MLGKRFKVGGNMNRILLKSIAADYYVVKSADLSELKHKIKMAFEGDEQLPPGTTANDLRKTVTPLQYTIWGIAR